MSQSIFLGVKNKLNKVDISGNEIFCIPDLYKNSFYFKEGILFDEHLDEYESRFFNKYFNQYNWYEIKGLPIPFEASLRYKDDLPDLYEASLQLSQWFCKFVKSLKSEGNEVAVVNLWVNNKEQNIKAKKKLLNISELDISDYEMPRDIIYELNC